MGLISGARQLVIDAWSWLNYKPIYADTRGMPHRRAFPEAAATWVPAADERRLAAYKLLAAYTSNQAGELAALRDGDEARDRREFGDPSMFVDTLVAHVLGDGQRIVVPGAEADDDSTDEQAVRVQTLLRDWAERELLPMRMLQTEQKAVPLGDGVYLLHWDQDKRRVRVRTYDPGFYFPVLPEDGDGSDYPERVHLAWELPEDPKRGVKARVRRITYELGWIEQGERDVVRGGLEDADSDQEPSVQPRQYPWNDEPSYRTCYLTDATWELGDLTGPVDVDSLPMDRASFAEGVDGVVLDRRDLMIDFVPLIHVPNTVPPAEEHWGQSSLAKALQVFDELAGADTDSSRASATTGSPIIHLSGKAASGRNQLAVGPGMILETGEGGRMDTVNTAPQLQELRSHRADLADRAAAVVRLPAVALGTLDPTKVPSGYALALSLGPLDSLISSMRLARAHKDQLLLKFVQRLHLAGQHPEWEGVTPQPAILVRGPYTPTDQAAVLEQVTTGVAGGVLSLETGVRMLQEAGYPIEDTEQEIRQIESRAFAAAKDLADALGNATAVAEFLDRKAPEAEEAPDVRLPPIPANAAEADAADPLQDGDDDEA
ncbi:hypothetical protein ABZ694_24735 [Streptomyces albidoflavus]|uniref:hypothetical protein n=1 Tax=Streptomyces albidoflavus TaxID=1886 RepID=UPI0033D64824